MAGHGIDPTLETPLPTRASEEGWVDCPHCGFRFKADDVRAWTGDRHARCGQRLDLNLVAFRGVVRDADERRLKLERERKRLMSEGLTVAVGVAVLSAIAAVVTMLVGGSAWNWSDSTLWVVGVSLAGLPTLAAAYLAWRGSTGAKETDICMRCIEPYAACWCCPDCNGSGNAGGQAGNWLALSTCLACAGSGKESPRRPSTEGTAKGPLCIACKQRRSGKEVRVVRLLHASAGPSGGYTRHTWEQAGHHWVFLCYKCGDGCANQRSAEDRAATILTKGAREAAAKGSPGLTRHERVFHPGAPGADVQYSGSTSWQESMKRP